ncbi:phosphatase PAP2 family protein [Paenibacillus thiaminolyticus]|uniref:Inositol phosphorylceramide synthase n=1 Tax=Paenibacillus thiaminolyticus TaxID=49283 RepID=A0A3A3H373_PANTH|nr:phosphatase PAP2 family protein [Paenibacillus thiaminolyticus]RJG23586.1 inositol phosphorylceramide synthase [Paenibacillus thiaminolyticus]
MRQKITWTQYRPLLWMLAIPVLNIFYGIQNRPGPRTYSLSTGWDERIPFVPEFIVPYIVWYPFIILTLFFLFRRRPSVYYRTLLALCLGLVICYMTYFFFQTTVARPDIEGSGMFDTLVRIIYWTDMPYNCFPSIHVLTSCLMYRSSLVFQARTRHFIRFTAAAIILSTLFVKQHVIADLFAGWFVAVFTYWMAGVILASGANYRELLKKRRQEQS